MKASNTPLEAGRESVAGSSDKLHSIPEALSLLGSMGRTWFYAEVAAGRIRVVKLGKRSLVAASEVARIIEEAKARASA